MSESGESDGCLGFRHSFLNDFLATYRRCLSVLESPPKLEDIGDKPNVGKYPLLVRKKIATLLTVVLLSSLSFNAHATVKSGTSCKKLGQTSLSSGKKYTCIKQGKKLVWDLGVVIQKVNKTPTSSPSSTDNLESSRYQAVKLKAYQNIRNAADSGNSANVILNLHISDSFPISLRETYLKQYKYASKLYGTFFAKPEIVNIYMYTEKDSELIQRDPNLSSNYSDFSPWFKDWEQGLNRDHNIGLAAFYVKRDGVWQGFAGSAVYSGSTASSLRQYAIQVQQHEFFHVVQDYFMQSGRGSKFNDQDSYDLLFPPTFREGSANTISFALATDNFMDYLSLYKNFIGEKKNQASVPIFSSLSSEKAVIEALNSIEFISRNPQAHEASYALGQLLYEYVIAQFGFNAYREIIQNQLLVENFDQNIEKSLGISKDELYRQAALHILRAFTTS